MNSYNFNIFTFRYYLDSKSKTIEEPDFTDSSEAELSLQTIETFNKATEYVNLTEKDFVERYSTSDNGYYYALSTDKINELKNFENIEIHIDFDISNFFAVSRTVALFSIM